MSEVTQAHLPAECVIAACRGTLEDIALSRQRILTDMAERRRYRGKLLPRRSLKKAFDLLVDSERSIARMHRAVEEQTTQVLLDLARAVAFDDPTFRVQVCARDFQVIHDHYQPGA